MTWIVNCRNYSGRFYHHIDRIPDPRSSSSLGKTNTSHSNLSRWKCSTSLHPGFHQYLSFESIPPHKDRSTALKSRLKAMESEAERFSVRSPYQRYRYSPRFTVGVIVRFDTGWMEVVISYQKLWVSLFG